MDRHPQKTWKEIRCTHTTHMDKIQNWIPYPMPFTLGRLVIILRKISPALPYHPGLITRGIVAFNFSPRNLTQVTSAMKSVQDSMVGFASVKRITLREGLY